MLTQLRDKLNLAAKLFDGATFSERLTTDELELQKSVELINHPGGYNIYVPKQFPFQNTQLGRFIIINKQKLFVAWHSGPVEIARIGDMFTFTEGGWFNFSVQRVRQDIEQNPRIVQLVEESLFCFQQIKVVLRKTKC